MPDRFYSFDDIIKSINCLDYALSIGLKPVQGGDHFNCPWRSGSDSAAFQISAESWTDHTIPKGSPDRSGSVIELCARIRHGGDIQAAQEELGDTLNLEPTLTAKAERVGRGKELEDKGYALTKTYDYHHPETGKVVHQVSRYEHPDKENFPKEFVQHTPTRPNIRGVATYLYRAQDWQDSRYVVLCEGEKDADNVASLGLPSTTNPSGAGNWQESWSKLLEGKHVVILEDNDEAGKKRSAYIAHQLKPFIQSVKIIRLPDLRLHGDVSDWIDDQSADKAQVRKDLLTIISESAAVQSEDIPDPDEDFEALQKAKALNRYEFKNYFLTKSEENSHEPSKQIPIHINKLTAEVHDRFLNFPRRQGMTMFDHDRDTGEIVFLDRPAKLFSWIQRKSNRGVRWSRKEGCVAREELFEALLDDAVQYNAISQVPDWPMRTDVYYAHEPLPEPSEDHRMFWDLVGQFEAQCPHDWSLIAAYLMSPIYYRYGMARPMWVIDSSRTGSGKTTLATTCALLYGTPAIEVKQRDLYRDTQEITKRMISPTGRQARVVLLDNITGSFGCEEIASMVTIPEITGRPVHGRNEESRPNNLTYTVTANNAAISDDIAIRSWMIMLDRPKEYKPNWREKLIQYVTENRMQIFADMVDILKNHKPFKDVSPSTRFPEVEFNLLQACCEDFQSYNQVVKLIFERTASANVEDDYGRSIEDLIREGLADAGINPNEHTVFIRSGLLNELVKEALPHRGASAVQTIRTLAAQGHLANIDPKRNMWPTNGENRRRGVVWYGEKRDASISFAVDRRGKKIVRINSRNQLISEEMFDEMK